MPCKIGREAEKARIAGKVGAARKRARADASRAGCDEGGEETKDGGVAAGPPKKKNNEQ